MKRLLLILCLAVLGTAARAQFFDKIKNKVNQKVNEALDGKSKKKSDKKADSTAAKPADSATPASEGEGATANTAAPSQPEDIKSYSKFDFVPGEKIIVAEDFAQDAIGEFPDKWNTKTGAEVVTLNNRPGKWLAMKQDGVFFPEYIPELPENFTLQLDMICNNEVASIASLIVALANTKSTDQKFDLTSGTSSINVPGIKVNMDPVSSGSGAFSYSTNILGSTSLGDLTEWQTNGRNFATLSIWRQKTRIRLYINSTKLLDLPRALEPGALLNTLAFGAYAVDYGKKGGVFYIGNIRLAVGAPDTRNKLITEGKFVTHGILFDVNSDKIKAQSFGALQDIANTLKENATVKVKIVGHTDSDGEDAANLDLSKRRAEAVKTMLSTNFGIDAARMTTEGKGESQPIDSNETSTGKANNRRVEFIKS